MNKKVLIIVGAITALVVLIVVLTWFLGVRTDYGYIKFNVTPKGAKATVNNQEFETGGRLKLRSGKYDIALSSSGYEDYVFKNVTIKKGDETIISRELLSNKATRFKDMLPYDDGLNFLIRLRDDGIKYVFDIGLYAIFNRPGQESSYLKQLRELKTEALKYVGGFGLSESDIHINWLQPEVNE